MWSEGRPQRMKHETEFLSIPPLLCFCLLLPPKFRPSGPTPARFTSYEAPRPSPEKKNDLETNQPAAFRPIFLATRVHLLHPLRDVLHWADAVGEVLLERRVVTHSRHKIAQPRLVTEFPLAVDKVVAKDGVEAFPQGNISVAELFADVTSKSRQGVSE